MYSNREAKVAYEEELGKYLKNECKVGSDECTITHRMGNKEDKDAYWQAVCKQGTKECKRYADQVCVEEKSECHTSIRKAYRKNGLGHVRKHTSQAASSRAPLSRVEIAAICAVSGLGLVFCVLALYLCCCKKGKGNKKKREEKK